MATTKPTSLTLRVYQVGFGDCFLLTFHYPTKNRHVLIDFGSNGQPDDAPANMLVKIAEDIKTECAGKLHAIVLTHRHKDHIAGFTTNDKKTGPGDIIAGLKPDVVIQPWTEDPKAAEDATKPTTQAFALSLDAMQTVSAGIAAECGRHARAETDPQLAELFSALEFLGFEAIKNKSAVDNLQQIGTRHAWVYHGSKSGLESVLPGVKVTVLGPPTLEQSSAIRSERDEDAAEFWQLQASAGEHLATNPRPVFPKAPRLSSTRPPSYARWFIPRLRAARAEQLLQIVRILDDQMNNTSVILLFEVGNQSFLFPGDAQIENWEYTLKKSALMERLAKVTLYKVGHHGSRNATPKSLWKNFANRSKTKTPQRLQTIVSTMKDKYGTVAEGTEVPRATLVKALKAESTFFTTQDLKGVLKKVFTIPL